VEGDQPSIVVTTNILGDVVSAVVGDLAEVEVVMPIGADPHDFAASVKQADSMENADLLVVNGAGFEQGMLGVIDSVASSGTTVFAFADAVELLPAGDEDDGHAAEDGHGAFDPHLWTDPVRLSAGVRALGARLAQLEGIDAKLLAQQVDAYVGELGAVDAQIADDLAVVPDQDRVLVTNHEVLGYFADRYGFEVVGAVVPSLTSNAGASSRELEELADTISANGIPAIFAETTQSTELAAALAAEVGEDVKVVELFTESLGEPGSGAEAYIDLMRTTADLIVDALTGP
jgi:zinc/manganese transport system substrate-binding protein